MMKNKKRFIYRSGSGLIFHLGNDCTNKGRESRARFAHAHVSARGDKK